MTPQAMRKLIVILLALAIALPLGWYVAARVDAIRPGLFLAILWTATAIAQSGSATNAPSAQPQVSIGAPTVFALLAFSQYVRLFGEFWAVAAIAALATLALAVHSFRARGAAVQQRPELIRRLARVLRVMPARTIRN